MPYATPSVSLSLLFRRLALRQTRTNRCGGEPPLGSVLIKRCVRNRCSCSDFPDKLLRAGCHLGKTRSTRLALHHGTTTADTLNPLHGYPELRTRVCAKTRGGPRPRRPKAALRDLELNWPAGGAARPRGAPKGSLGCRRHTPVQQQLNNGPGERCGPRGDHRPPHRPKLPPPPAAAPRAFPPRRRANTSPSPSLRCSSSFPPRGGPPHSMWTARSPLASSRPSSRTSPSSPPT